jgi:hypothetical protein
VDKQRSLFLVAAFVVVIVVLPAAVAAVAAVAFRKVATRCNRNAVFIVVVVVVA